MPAEATPLQDNLLERLLKQIVFRPWVNPVAHRIRRSNQPRVSVSFWAPTARVEFRHARSLPKRDGELVCRLEVPCDIDVYVYVHLLAEYRDLSGVDLGGLPPGIFDNLNKLRSLYVIRYLYTHTHGRAWA